MHAYDTEIMSFLRKAGIQTPQMIALLTDGMPNNYKNFLLIAPITTCSQWLLNAQRLEASFQSTAKHERFNRQQSNHTTEIRSFNQNNRPKTPCRYCKEHNEIKYHWHNECPRRPNVRPIERSTSKQPSKSNEQSKAENKPAEQTNSLYKNEVEKFINFEVEVNGKLVRAMLDTGSTCSIISDKLCKQLSLKIFPHTDTEISQVKGIVRSTGQVEIHIAIGSISKTIRAYVLFDF